ncbi:hypothetical protein NP511_02155 [Natrinema thermotolerans]|uniref:Uncharacterized protein n=1 Tax=Natrinema thermotolerans TaxID=121872 RepID=A0AAF0PFM3_9EURY|nr:hypothetical protein [Natrinema thermotolerans]WPH65863.1 hypothetical protein HJTV4_gp40 [Haloarchaeal virus HJTV-4]QCC60768.1 hypothetical protein DVR14_19845 [Natrinema thermotolerans]QCC61647.1 hypothetical protein DVR14_23980 [Natrinema thermotolerans]WMT07813.1 hypothetical protein NP511_20870 [Natrinema thermotolerans]WMT08445.1 hypothetical protein NP511_02155 [Natrinema thermotolerans]
MQLYTLEFNEDEVGQISVGASPDTTEQTPLDDRGSAEMLAGPTPEISFDVVVDGPDGRRRASELEHLLSQPTVAPVAVSIPNQPDLEGYYVGSSVDRDVVLSQDGGDDHHVVPLTLSRSGTQQSHDRVLETDPTEDIDHEYGNDTTLLVGLPAAADRVQWFDLEDKTRQLASPIETRSAEGGDIEIYDLADGEAAVGTGSPAIVYDLDLEADGDVDVGVFDTQGSEDRADWARIVSPKASVDDPVVLDNGLARLRLDEPAGTLEAQQWDATNETWTTVGLEGSQPSTVTLFDVDLVDVAMARDQAQLTFDVDGSLFSLNAIVNRGAEDVLFSIPTNESGPIPTDLEDWLAPIASSSVVDPNASKALVARNEVRK